MSNTLITHFDLDPSEKEELERVRQLAEERGEYLHIEIRKETPDA